MECNKTFKQKKILLPIILSGGNGKRLLPLSTAAHPKQFLRLTNNFSLLQNTIKRLEKNKNILPPLIVSNLEHKKILLQQLKEIDAQFTNIFFEPLSRNTAPAITLATIAAYKNYADPIILILPSDHHIENKVKFQQALTNATKLANKNFIVTFGVLPKDANTNYGYIKTENLDNKYIVKSFKEKPSSALAKKYLRAKNYFWNSGMLMFKASIFLNKIKLHQPKLFDICNKINIQQSIKNKLSFYNQKIFAQLPNISIDYAFMEKIKNALMVPLNCGWSDIGSWQTLTSLQNNVDKNGNITIGNIICEQVKNSYIYTQNKKIVAIDINNLIIIETDNTILISNKNNCAKIKTFY